jgi:hypothetical protein
LHLSIGTLVEQQLPHQEISLLFSIKDNYFLGKGLTDKQNL